MVGSGFFLPSGLVDSFHKMLQACPYFSKKGTLKKGGAEGRDDTVRYGRVWILSTLESCVFFHILSTRCCKTLHPAWHVGQCREWILSTLGSCGFFPQDAARFYTQHGMCGAMSGVDSFYPRVLWILSTRCCKHVMWGKTLYPTWHIENWIGLGGDVGADLYCFCAVLVPIYRFHHIELQHIELS